MFLGMAKPRKGTAWAVSSLRSAFCQSGSAVDPLRCMDGCVLKDFASFPFGVCFVLF